MMKNDCKHLRKDGTCADDCFTCSYDSNTGFGCESYEQKTNGGKTK